MKPPDPGLCAAERTCCHGNVRKYVLVWADPSGTRHLCIKRIRVLSNLPGTGKYLYLINGRNPDAPLSPNKLGTPPKKQWIHFL